MCEGQASEVQAEVTMTGLPWPPGRSGVTYGTRVALSGDTTDLRQGSTGQPLLPDVHQRGITACEGRLVVKCDCHLVLI